MMYYYYILQLLSDSDSDDYSDIPDEWKSVTINDNKPETIIITNFSSSNSPIVSPTHKNLPPNSPVGDSPNIKFEPIKTDEINEIPEIHNKNIPLKVYRPTTYTDKLIQKEKKQLIRKNSSPLKTDPKPRRRSFNLGKSLYSSTPLKLEINKSEKEIKEENKPIIESNSDDKNLPKKLSFSLKDRGVIISFYYSSLGQWFDALIDRYDINDKKHHLMYYNNIIYSVKDIGEEKWKDLKKEKYKIIDYKELPRSQTPTGIKPKLNKNHSKVLYYYYLEYNKFI